VVDIILDPSKSLFNVILGLFIMLYLSHSSCYTFKKS